MAFPVLTSAITSFYKKLDIFDYIRLIFLEKSSEYVQFIKQIEKSYFHGHNEILCLVLQKVIYKLIMKHFQIKMWHQ